MKKKKKFYMAAGLIALICCIFISCSFDPHPNAEVFVRKGDGTQLIRPGAMHTQEDFVALRKLMDRWHGIERDWSVGNGAWGPQVGTTTPMIPEAPDFSNELTPREIVETYRPGHVFAARPSDFPVSFEWVWAHREIRAANRRMFAEWRAWESYREFWAHPDGAFRNFHRDFSATGWHIGRDGWVGGTSAAVSGDMRIAYFNAMRWVLTGDRRHAETAFQVLDTYGRNLQGFGHGGFYDYMLMVGMQGHLKAVAADIIRHGRDVVTGQGSGFIDEQFYHIDRSIRDIWLYAVIHDYVNVPSWRATNQGCMIMAAYIAIAIYLDDRPLLEQAIEFLVNGEIEASIRVNFNPTSGQAREATRSQGYAGLGIGKTVLAAEAAWNQGYNVFGAHNNVLWRAQEFFARFNMGDNNLQSTNPRVFCPFAPDFFFDPEGNQWNVREISVGGRGYMGPGAEILYNHFVRRMGMPMPWTEAMLGFRVNAAGEIFGGAYGWHAVDSPPGFTSFLSVGRDLARELGLM